MSLHRGISIATYKIRVYRGDNAACPYVDYLIQSDFNLEIGDKVALIFQSGDNPQIVGPVDTTPIAKIVDSAHGNIEYKNVLVLKNLNLSTNDKVLIDFINGDISKPIILQNVDTTTRVHVQDNLRSGLIVQAYPPLAGLSGYATDNVPVVFARGDLNQGVLITPGFQLSIKIADVFLNLFETQTRHNWYHNNRYWILGRINSIPAIYSSLAGSGSWIANLSSLPSSGYAAYNIDTDNNTAHVVRNYGGDIYYNPITLNEDGTVTWGSSTLLYTHGSSSGGWGWSSYWMGESTAATSSNNHRYAGFLRRYTLSYIASHWDDYYYRIWRSDGVPSSEWLCAHHSFVSMNDYGTVAFKAGLISIGNDILYAIVAIYDYDIGPMGTFRILGRSYNALTNTWGPEENLSGDVLRESTVVGVDSIPYAIAAQGSDVYLTFQCHQDIMPPPIYFKKRGAPSRETVATEYWISPNITVDVEGNCWIIWAKDKNAYYRKRQNDGTWKTIHTWFLSPVYIYWSPWSGSFYSENIATPAKYTVNKTYGAYLGSVVETTPPVSLYYSPPLPS